MKIEIKDISPVKKSLLIEADLDEVREETEDVVRRFARQAKIPGFRSGKVPLSLVKTRYSKEIREDVRDRLMARLHTEATAEKSLSPIADPLLEEVSFEEGQPLRFRTTFEVRPEFTPTNYRGIEVREASASLAADEVDRTLEEIRKSQVKLVTEDGRPATTGDIVVADVEGTPETGDPVRRERVHIEVGATANLPAFNDGLLGATAGEVREFLVSYPREYEAKHLAGQNVRYRITVHEVKRSELPELDDELAKDLGEFENLAALRARIRADLEERKRHEVRQMLRQSLLDKLLLENPIPLPDTLVEDEVHHRLEDVIRSLMTQGIDPRKIELDWKDLRERQVEPARKAVHARLVLDAIASREGITADAREIDDRIRLESERSGIEPAAMKKRLAAAGGLEALQNQMVREKSLDFLSSVANILREG